MHRVRAFFEETARNALAGTEAEVAAFSSTITAANLLYRTLRNTVRSAIEVAQANFDVVADAASKSAGRVNPQREQTAR
jgi:hypothetical protein